MSAATPLAGPDAGPDADYDAAACYYDIMAAAQGAAALPSVRFFAELARPGDLVLDVGAGTGRVALTVAATAAHVYCLEPSRAMRAALLARLADQPALWPRVTVLAGAAPRFELPVRADYACLAGVMQYVCPAERAGFFDTLAAHLRPGAVLAMDMIADGPAVGWPARLIQAVPVGECCYTLHCAAEPDGPARLRTRLTYRTLLHGRAVATDQVERIRYLHSPAATQADLRSSGFVVTGGSVAGPAGDEPAASDGGTLISRLASCPPPADPMRRPRRT